MIDYSIYKMTVKDGLTLIVVLIALLELVGLLIYDTAYGFVLLPAVYLIYSKKYEAGKKDKRCDRLRSQFRDVLYSLSSAFSAGENMVGAMKNSISMLDNIHGENSEMALELKSMVRKITETGDEEVELWLDLGKRSSVEDIRDFSEVFAGCRDSGGDLAKMVDRAADVLSEKIGIENEIRIMASQKVFEGRIVGLMPFVMILFLRFTSPSYMRVMYETFLGRILMSVSLAIIVTAFVITERITKIEI